MRRTLGLHAMLDQSLLANLPDPNPTTTLHNFNAATVTSFLPGLRARSRWDPYCDRRRRMISGSLEKGSVETRRMRAERAARTAAESWELFVCRAPFVSSQLA
jgi:hypothetical protein